MRRTGIVLGLLLCFGLYAPLSGMMPETPANDEPPVAVDSGNATDADATDAAVNQPEVVESSMHEFMEYVFQPTYRRLRKTMAAAPTDNKGWKAIKSDALILAESNNLLFARLPKENADDWARHSAKSRDDGGRLYKAARQKDFDAATVAWKSMLNNCNACHRQFENGKHILKP